jgi:hypothetical protein
MVEPLGRDQRAGLGGVAELTGVPPAAGAVEVVVEGVATPQAQSKTTAARVMRRRSSAQADRNRESRAFSGWITGRSDFPSGPHTW